MKKILRRKSSGDFLSRGGEFTPEASGALELPDVSTAWIICRAKRLDDMELLITGNPLEQEISVPIIL